MLSRSEVEGGLAAIGTLVAKECEAIKEFVKDRDVGKLQAVVEEVKQENGEKAAEKIEREVGKEERREEVVKKIEVKEAIDADVKDDFGIRKKKKRSVATDKQAHQYATNTITTPNITPQNHSGVTKAPEGRSQD